MKKLKTYSVFTILLFAAFVFIVNLASVDAEVIIYNEDTEQNPYCMNFSIDKESDFTISSITINGDEYDYDFDHALGPNNEDINSYEFRNSSKNYEIIIYAGKDSENHFPHVSTAGGFEDAGGTLTSLVNTAEDQNVVGDEYVFTINIGEGLYNGVHEGPTNEHHCSGFGITLSPNGPDITATTNGSVTGLMNVTINGENLAWHELSEEASPITFAINNSPMVFLEGENLTFTKNGNNEITSATTKEAVEMPYDYDSDTVTFHMNMDSTMRIEELTINGHEYATPYTREQRANVYDRDALCLVFDVPNVARDENGEYDVVINGLHLTSDDDLLTGGFGWNYSAEGDVDSASDRIPHGDIQFVSATYNNVEYTDVATMKAANGLFEWVQGTRKDHYEIGDRSGFGYAFFPVGTVATVKIIPDPGYQLLGLRDGGDEFTREDEPGVYTFDIHGYGKALGVDFQEVNNEVRVGIDAVSSGTIESDEQIEAGTLRLDVKDIGSMSPGREADFLAAAEEEDEALEREFFMDIDLYNTIYKGGSLDQNNNYESWDTPLNNLANNATITLELTDDFDGKDLKIVHEEHDAENNPTDYVVIDAAYDPDNNTVTFETNGFSTFALFSKNANNDNPNNPDNPDNPDDPEGPAEGYVRVSFNTAGADEDVEYQDILAGAKATEPNVELHKHGLVFGGWYVDDTFNAEFDFDSNVNESIELVAYWQVQVDFNSHGGSNVASKLIAEGTAVQKPDDPNYDDNDFLGWFEHEEDEDPFDFSTELYDNIELHAKWALPTEEQNESDEAGNEVTFEGPIGHTFELYVLDLDDVTDAVLAELTGGMSREDFEAAKEQIAEGLSDLGTMLLVYDISILDVESDELVEDVPVQIRIKMTDDMKAYNSFKLFCLSSGQDEIIDLTVQDGYLVGTLPHLSVYALMATTVEESSNTPKTGDNIMFYAGMLLVSALSAYGVMRYRKNN